MLKFKEADCNLLVNKLKKRNKIFRFWGKITSFFYDYSIFYCYFYHNNDKETDLNGRFVKEKNYS